jgi:hypothetical protein
MTAIWLTRQAEAAPQPQIAGTPQLAAKTPKTPHEP